MVNPPTHTMPRSSSTRWSQRLPARCPLARCSPPVSPLPGGEGGRWGEHRASGHRVEEERGIVW
eukprot:9888061-Alexandrium_andersonii.AAC.1